MKSILLFLLRAYKLTISPYLGQNCRFYPSCSAYAELAVRRHGVLKGVALTGKRLCKCHPWHSGGVDLVPEAEGSPCPKEAIASSFTEATPASPILEGIMLSKPVGNNISEQRDEISKTRLKLARFGDGATGQAGTRL